MNAETRDTQYESLMKTGEGAYSAIAEMVAALNCDYDRLEELRDEREALEDAIKEAFAADRANAEEYRKAHDETNNALIAWEDENGEELKELESAAGECTDRDDAEQRIHEDALSVEMRSGWATSREEMNQPEEFKILLATGGPAVQIRGELDDDGVPRRAWLEVQDWGTPWTHYSAADSDTLLAYCRCFYFGE
jgi:hypothetical protein